MIQATFKRKNNQIYWYLITGHANADVHGKDIVCASVSSLYIATVNTLHSFGRQFEKDGGYYLPFENSEDAAALAVLVNGVKGIAEEYPDYVRVTELRS